MKIIEKILIWLLDWIQSREAARTLGAARSPQWERVRKTWITVHPFCAVCGTSENCEVHHKQPFHLHPALELDPTNFITLCRPHHYLFGHFMNWSSFNATVVDDSSAWNDRIENRPR